jgi:hypothetical protein
MGFAFPRGVCERLMDISGYLHHRLDGERAANGVNQCPYLLNEAVRVEATPSGALPPSSLRGSAR